MKIFLFLIAFVISGVTMSADNYLNLEPLKLDVPEMKPELVEVVRTPLNYELNDMAPEPKMDFDFFKSKTNPGVKEYKFMDDLTFVGASILHKEYGLTRSPWYSVAGYGVATATGIMRILNNRHWISDVMSGAGIGIMSTELGYAIGDVLFKNKGLLRGDLEGVSDKPSFFAISMGLSYGLKSLSFSDDNLMYADSRPTAFPLSSHAQPEFSVRDTRCANEPRCL